jgi:hypothetical protein
MLFRHENGQEVEIHDENHVSLMERNGFKLVEEAPEKEKKKADGK